MNDITALDIIAPVWFILCWACYTWFADSLSTRGRNIVAVMNEYRLQWMRQMMNRDNRMMDATLIGNLLRSIAFFASTTIFIVLGLFTMFKYRQEAIGIIGTIPSATPATPILWEAKIFLLVIIFVYAFFKLTWSLRQYNYACVLVGAAPPPAERGPHFDEYARNAGRLVGNAAKHFNQGLRAYNFGLAALSWFVNDYAFIAASSWVVLVLYRREFRSHALQYLMNPMVFREE